jgi:hypothetical protein
MCGAGGTRARRVASDKMRRSVLFGVVVAELLAGFFPAAVQADLYTVFDRDSAQPGQRVEVRTQGIVTGTPRVTVYLVPLRLAKSGAHQTSTGPPSDARWLRIGPLLPAGSQGGQEARISFVLPATLPPGDYTIGFWCRPCAPPKGATFTSARPGQRWSQDAHLQKIIRVLPLAPATQSEPSASASASSRLWLAALGIGGLVAVSALLIRRRGRG